MKSDTAIADSLGRFTDHPHSIGDKSQGWDCLNSLLEFYRSMGVEMPVRFEDYDEMNYAKRWKRNSHRCMKDFSRFLKSLGEKIEISFAERGDFFILKTEVMDGCPAIHAGNGKMMLVLETGVRFVEINHLKKYIVEARRLIK